MKTLIVYFSKFGNTHLIAEAITETLFVAGAARLLSADQLTAADLEGIDLLVMGTPTHNMNLPKAVRPVLASLPKRVLKGVPFAAFDTSYKMSWWLNHFTAGKRLSRVLRKLGGKQIVLPETFLVMKREGPLYEGELDRAYQWADTVRRGAETMLG